MPPAGPGGAERGVGFALASPAGGAERGVGFALASPVLALVTGPATAALYPPLALFGLAGAVRALRRSRPGELALLALGPPLLALYLFASIYPYPFAHVFRPELAELDLLTGDAILHAALAHLIQAAGLPLAAPPPARRRAIAALALLAALALGIERVRDLPRRFAGQVELVTAGRSAGSPMPRIAALVEAAKAGASPRELAVFVPPENGDFWGREDLCQKRPFLVPALTGVPMLAGVPSRCPAIRSWGAFCCGDYDARSVNRALSNARLCGHAERRGISRVFVLRSLEQPERNETLRCGAQGHPAGARDAPP